MYQRTIIFEVHKSNILIAEVISFPAGGIAAIIVGCIVIVLVLVKVVCVISGWEEKLPDGRSQQEDQKHMLDTDELAPDAAPPNDNHDSKVYSKSIHEYQNILAMMYFFYKPQINYVL